MPAFARFIRESIESLWSFVHRGQEKSEKTRTVTGASAGPSARPLESSSFGILAMTCLFDSDTEGMKSRGAAQPFFSASLPSGPVTVKVVPEADGVALSFEPASSPFLQGCRTARTRDATKTPTNTDSTAISPLRRPLLDGAP